MKKNGFTLVELLAVIAITAVLAVIAVPSILKLYNNSLKNSFKTESLAVLKSVDDDLSIDYNDITEYDCTKDNENTFKKCTITIENGKPILDAEGTGKFSNFVASNITLNGSGEVINIGKLENYQDENIVISYSLIDKTTNKLNDKFTKKSFADIAVDLQEVPDFKNKFAHVNAMLTGDYSNIEVPEGSSSFYITASSYISDGKIYGGDIGESGDESAKIKEMKFPLFIAPFDISDKEAGTYQFNSQGIKGDYKFMIISKNKVFEQLKGIESEQQLDKELQNIIYNSLVPSNDGTGATGDCFFGNYYVKGNRYDFSSPVVTLSENDTYYIAISLMDTSGETDEASIISQISMDRINTVGVKLKGDKKVLLTPSEVDKYKDEGISASGNLKENKNYITHTNLNKQIGDYNYSYIFKQNGTVNSLARNIYVVSEKYTDYLKKKGSTYYLEKDTNKYRFYCSVTNSYISTNNECNFACGKFGYIRVESTETSFAKIYMPLPTLCSPAS